VCLDKRQFFCGFNPGSFGVLEHGKPKRRKCKSCYGPLNPYKKVKTIEEARGMVMDLVADWPPCFPGAAWRPHPNDAAKIIAVAGGLSWGDTPDGAGFQALDRLAKSGVYSKLGFEQDRGTMCAPATHWSSPRHWFSEAGQVQGHGTKILRQLYP
jgi:hypothetical protein